MSQLRFPGTSLGNLHYAQAIQIPRIFCIIYSLLNEGYLKLRRDVTYQKVKLCLYYVMKTMRGSRGIAPPIFNLGSTQGE